MAIRRGHRVRRAAGGLPLLACLLGVAGPALGETAPGATLTFVPPPAETKIVVSDPPPGSVPPSPAPVPPPAEAPPPAPPPPDQPPPPPDQPPPPDSSPPPPPTVSADSPALRALVAASDAERRRLRAQIPGLATHVATMEAGIEAAQAELSARQADVQAIQTRTAEATTDFEQAESHVARTESSASSAADAVLGHTTPVARPPAKGHSPRDHAVQAHRDLAAALQIRLQRSQVLGQLRQELDVARESESAASAALNAKVEELQRGRESLAQQRQQLAAAEQAAPHMLTAPTNALATATIPTGYLWLYGQAAARCSGLPWTVLAAVGSVESAHGQSTAPGVHSGANFAGAMGPMQFLADTWAAYGVDGDGDGVRDVYNPADAIFGAANYLCASGAGNVTTLRLALWHYNHADWYVEMVLELAARYSV